MKRLNFIWTIVFMAVIGAVIGGFTNHLAIKMLFRPHEAKYIGKWRLPFTPGLIPKRRDELAVQLGRTVTNYLLTPETFRKKLLTPQMEKKAEQFIQEKIEQYVFQSDRTLNDWISLSGAANFAEQAEGKVLSVIDSRLNNMRAKLTTGTVAEVVPEKWQEQAAEQIPKITVYMLDRANQYVNSFEGKVMFQKLINDFLESKGTFGGVLNMFFGDSNSLVEKVQREATKFIEAPGTNHLLRTMIDKEFNKLKNRPVDELLSGFDWDGAFNAVKAYVKRELAFSDRFDKTIQDYFPNGAQWTAEKITPKLTSFAFEQAEKQLEISLSKLKLDEIVKEQVDSFPVAVLEDLVLGISRREFKMITVLGALLGGLIGIVQGVIVLLTNL
ncbi:DUF445 family protein [Sporosarcina sp. USHLN248]|uniref:DUF445 domain-containing protein n=1 Tax=Sporosarcina sp. USHLN248 TaxID=3081300 RepID=UPI0030194286